MQCACAIFSSVACPALQYFSTLSHKRHDFRNKVINHDMCVSSLSVVLCQLFLILRGTERDIINMYIGLHVQYLLFLSDNNETGIFWIDFRKLLRYQILRESVHWEPNCTTWADGRT
jgi:hypothetical protein